MPQRACSSWVTGLECGAGLKSQAVLEEASGIPGVSGDENVNGPPIFASVAKLPIEVPCFSDDGFAAPARGNW